MSNPKVKGHPEPPAGQEVSSTPSSQSSAPPLLRCTSTPIMPTYFKLEKGSGHLCHSASLTEEEGDSGIHSLSLEASSSLLLASSCQSSDDSAVPTSPCRSPTSSSTEREGAVPKRPVTRLSWARRRQFLRDRDTCSAPTLAPSRGNTDIRKEKRFIYLPGHFIGWEKVDVIRRLSEIGASFLLESIFRYLSDPDLCSISQVSTIWRATLAMHAETSRRKREFLLKQKLNMENLDCSSSAYFGSPRKTLGNKTNIAPTSPNSKRKKEAAAAAAANTYVSPSKIRHKLFTQEASKLEPGEMLQCCPRCTSPSRVVPSEFLATCSRRACAFAFCTRCLCAAHADGNVCHTPKKNSAKSVARTRGSGVASKKSMCRLKRL